MWFSSPLSLSPIPVLKQPVEPELQCSPVPVLQQSPTSLPILDQLPFSALFSWLPYMFCQPGCPPEVSNSASALHPGLLPGLCPIPWPSAQGLCFPCSHLPMPFTRDPQLPLLLQRLMTSVTGFCNLFFQKLTQPVKADGRPPRAKYCSKVSVL